MGREDATLNESTMSDLLNKLLQASDWTDIVDAARALSARDNPSDVPQLIAALKDPLEQRRWGAVYALGFSRQDRRAVVPLVEVLLDKRETPRVRAQAAECLGMIGRRKALKPVIECSTDDSAEVRFWCVFALGAVLAKMPAAATQTAITDCSCPGGTARRQREP
jgi:HEAT repeat protein